MKSQRGVTLAGLIMYVVAMTVIVGIIGTITSFFYSNTANMSESATNLGEFNKFNVAFLEEVKKAGNSVYRIDKDGTRITFSSGTVFIFQDAGIYKDKVKICKGVTNCKFSTSKQEEKEIVTVLIEIGEKVPYVKTVEYVMNYESITSTSNLESDYSQSTVADYVQNGLQIHYDAINNTGDGHSNTTTTWRDLSGNHRDGIVTNVTWDGYSAGFNGTSSWVNCGEMNFDYVTIEVVVEYNSYSEIESTCIACNFENGGYGLCTDGGATEKTHNAFYVDLNGSYVYVAAPEEIVTQKKYSLIGCYNGSEITLWENGQKQQVTASGEITFPQINTVMALGTNPAAQNSWGRFFNGKIYAVRIYDRGLTEEEIMHNYEIDKVRYGI